MILWRIACCSSETLLKQFWGKTVGVKRIIISPDPKTSPKCSLPKLPGALGLASPRMVQLLGDWRYLHSVQGSYLFNFRASRSGTSVQALHLGGLYDSESLEHGRRGVYPGPYRPTRTPNQLARAFTGDVIPSILHIIANFCKRLASCISQFVIFRRLLNVSRSSATADRRVSRPRRRTRRAARVRRSSAAPNS
jgi:hypothetical protein